MHKIIVTGPECSGKTTLSKSLSKYFNSKLVNEFARNYLAKKNNTYNFENLLEIAQNQFFFDALYPKDSIRNLHLNPRLTMAKAPHIIEITINL